MQNEPMSRRNFSRLTAAAIGGLAAGAMAPKMAGAAEEQSLLLRDPHICRGLNTCKGLGATKKNDCAGMGTCATIDKHSCKGDNDCKGHGGCGEHPGENSCKTKGDCSVPLSDETWKVARDHFEKAMKKAGKKFGDAPKK